MIACLISFVCFALTVPMQVIMTFLRANNKRMVAKDKKQTKAQKGDTDGDKKGGVTLEAQLKERFSAWKKSLKIKDPKMRAIAITLEALIISLKFLINVLRAVAMIVQVMGIVGLLMMFIVLIALLAAVGGCIIAVMGDGWQGISGGSYTPTGGGLASSGGTYDVNADTAKIIAMSESEIWLLISEGKYKSYDEANAAAQADMEGEEAFWTGLLESVQVPCWKFSESSKVESTVTIKVNKHLAGFFKDFMTDLYNLPEKYVIVDIGGFSFRAKNNGSGTSNLSGHSFGAVLDINFSVDGMGSYAAGYGEKGKPWKTSNGLSDPVLSECCTFDNSWNSLIPKYKLDWGGNWSLNSLDPMHFSVVGDRNKDTRVYTPKWEGRTP